MPLSISKRLTLRHFFSPFVQCTSAGITVGQRTQSDRTADAISDEKRVCQKSNKMSCKPKSIDF